MIGVSFRLMVRGMVGVWVRFTYTVKRSYPLPTENDKNRLANTWLNIRYP